jgi:hypothetical protein
MRPSAAILALSASLLVLAGPVSASGTVLYMHLLGGQDMPITPQAPGEDYTADDSFGAATPSLSCFPATPAVGFVDTYHTVYAYATPSHIDYGRPTGEGLPEMHPSRGLLDAVPLAGAQPVVHWYWSTQVVADDGMVPTPIPNVVVQVTMRAGAAISVDDVAYNTGELLAEGRSAPAVLAGQFSSGAEHSMVDSRSVYHFTIPLEVKADAIPKEGYNLRIDTYVLRDGCPAEGYFTPNVLSAHTSPGHRPRMELATVQPPRIHSLLAKQDNGTWTFDVRANSPWGGADVANLTVSVQGPSEARSIEVTDYEAPAHCHCDEIFAAYDEKWSDTRILWDAAGDEAKPGDYTVAVSLTNLQGTANATSSARFQIAAPKESPGPGPAVVVLGMAALAIALRRRA